MLLAALAVTCCTVQRGQPEKATPPVAAQRGSAKPGWPVIPADGWSDTPPQQQAAAEKLRDHIQRSGVKNPSVTMTRDGMYCVDLSGSNIEDLSVLKGVPLAQLNLNSTNVRDLSPLAGMKLTKLKAAQTPIQDLRPLADMPLNYLVLYATSVKDLTPLRGMKFRKLYIAETPVTDLPPLANTTVQILCFTPNRIEKGMTTLRRMTSLEKLGHDPEVMFEPAEFWNRYDARRYSRKNGKPIQAIDGDKE